MRKYKKLQWKRIANSALYDLLTVIALLVLLSISILIVQAKTTNLVPLLLEFNNAHMVGDQDLIDEADAAIGPAVIKGIYLALGLFIVGTVLFCGIFSFLQRKAWDKKVKFWNFLLFNFSWMLLACMIVMLEASVLPPMVVAWLLIVKLILSPYIFSAMIYLYEDKSFFRAYYVWSLGVSKLLWYLVGIIIFSLLWLILLGLSGAYALIPLLLGMIFIMGASREWVRR